MPDPDVRGFTLVELMVVVVIIGVLAAIAIPGFARFQLQARHAEVPTVMGKILHAERAFAARWSAFGEFGPEPQGFVPNGGRAAWSSCVGRSDGHCLIGLGAIGRTSFVYAVAADGGAGLGLAARVSPSAQVVLGTDAAGYSCLLGTFCAGQNGAADARVDVADITVSADGDLDGDGAACFYTATDEGWEPRPAPAGCGTTTF